MMVSERERNGYASNYDYEALRNDRYARYDYERSYEEDRGRTTDSYRESLMHSLERPASRSRLEREDENRYGFYMANIDAGENNYDKFWDAKHKGAKKEKAPSEKRRLAFMITYIVVAVVALIAVTLAVVGMGAEPVVVSKTITGEKVTATAETDAKSQQDGLVAAEEEAQVELPGGENYIMLASGELVELEMPARQVKTEEEENGFDKFCTWMNGVFGG